MLTSLPALRRLGALVLLLAAASFIAGCHGTAYPTSTTWPLGGTVWKLVQLNGASVAANHLPSLTFDTVNHQVSGFAGVNTLSGSYTQQETALSFGPLAVTRKAGDPKKMQLEANFLQTLGRVTSWKIDGAILSFFVGETEVARFQGMPAGSRE